MNTYEPIYAVVRKIPEGSVASYAQVGRALGMRNCARLVGWAMRRLEPGSDVPWWRVINSKRRISIVNPRVSKTDQQRLLEGEGVAVEERDGWLMVVGDSWAEL
jgi:methylated-DNA-protein-cysteine methyltransferase related protein